MNMLFRVKKLVSVGAIFLPLMGYAQSKSLSERKKNQEVYINLMDEAPNLDPTKQVDQVSNFWLGHMYEGLMAYDQKGNIVPGAAEKMVVSPDQKTYTFTIRKDAKWHDGKPVTAQDFEFTFRRLVDPAYASQYAFIGETAQIVNASEIIAKKKPLAELGVKAKDDHTLVVQLKNPVAFFPQLMAFCTFYPVRQDFVKKYGDKFATSAESMVGNGPFKLVKWVRENSKRLEKVESYWNAKAIKLKAIEEPSIIKDQASQYNVFVTNGIDFAERIDAQRLKLASKDKLSVKSFLDGSSWYLELNTRKGRPFSHPKLRQALRLAMNRGELVKKVIAAPGNLISFGVIPDVIPGSSMSVKYRNEAPLSWKDGDVEGAKKFVNEYLKETKQAKMPDFTILAGDTTAAKRDTEYFQNYFKKVFGNNIKVETVPFKTRLQKMRDFDFDVVYAGWGPDYLDGMTYADLFTSLNENNHTGWSSKKYDELVHKASVSADLKERVKIFGELEKILVDEAPIVPFYQRANQYLLSKGFQGVRRTAVGADPDFRFASWAP